jgi:prepilin-type N-terminal cleavage/methylation domain-containing protein
MDPLMATSNQRGLTLIEVLVVLAIIGILTAILLPVLSQAKAKAQRYTCLAQLDQIGKAFIGYANNHDDRLPWQLTPTHTREEFGEHAEDYGLDLAAMFSVSAIRLDLGSAEILLSPCDPERTAANEKARTRWSQINPLEGRLLPSDAISYVLIDGADVARPGTVLAATRNLSTCNLGTAHWSGADDPNAGPETMAGLMRGQGQIVFADGSARLSSNVDLGETGVVTRAHDESAGGTYRGPAPTCVLGCGHAPELISGGPLKPGELFQVAQSGKGNRYVFVVDCSGSMNRDQRMGLAKREIIASLREMEKDKEFFVYYYNDGSIPMRGGVTTPTRENLTRAIPWIYSRIASGNTNPRDALRDAFTEKEPSTIWLLTDGIFLQRPGLKPVAELIRELNEKDEVRVNTIGFHRDRKAVDRSLGPIAAANDGTFRFVNSTRK